MILIMYYHTHLNNCFPCLHGVDGFHACMGWVVSMLARGGWFLMKDFQIFADFSFFWIAFVYHIPRFLKSSSGKTAADQEGSAFTRPSIF